MPGRDFPPPATGAAAAFQPSSYAMRAGNETQNAHPETVTVVRTPFFNRLCAAYIAVSEKYS